MRPLKRGQGRMARTPSLKQRSGYVIPEGIAGDGAEASLRRPTSPPVPGLEGVLQKPGV